MFPASYQTVGYIPAGTQVSDPANDPQLLSETESHYWFQFDTGSGMKDADPLMPGATIGQTFTTSTGTFAAVPIDLEETTEVQLVAEIYSTADAAFGLNAFQDTTVLDQTFDDVELVGRPLTIGNFVSTTSTGSIFTATTNTYTPYIEMGDEALPASEQPEAITGTPYQEVLTNFPLASQILTGLFLNVTLSGPGTISETISRALVDRVGYAARQGLASPENLSVNPSDPPIIMPFDMTTLNILPGLQSPGAAKLLQEEANQEIASVSAEANPAALDQTDALIAFARAELASFTVASDQETANLESQFSVAAYFDVPRITMFSSQFVTANNQSSISFGFDLVKDSLQAIASPGQNLRAALGFAGARGLFDSFLEDQALPVLPGGQNLSAAAVIQESMQQGIPMAVISASNISALRGFEVPPDALARITKDVESGLTLIVPTEALIINGSQTTAWFNVDPTTGEVIAQSEDGGDLGLVEYGAVLRSIQQRILVLATSTIITLSSYAAANPATTQAKLKAYVFLQDYLTSPTLPAPPIPTEVSLLVLVPAYFALTIGLALGDPPLSDSTFGLELPFVRAEPNQFSATGQISPNLPAGFVSGSNQAASVSLSNQVTVAWQSTATVSYQARAMEVPIGTITDSGGNIVGSGGIGVSAVPGISMSASGNDRYAIAGAGSLSFYGPAETSLGVSGDWQNYTATVTGNVSITLTSRLAP